LKIQNLGIAFIGTGAIAHTHAQAVRLIPQARRVAAFDPNKAAAQRFAESYGFQRVHETLEAVLSDTQVDAVHLLTPPETHLDLVRRCLEAGKPVLAEKPMFSNPADFALFEELLAKHPVACSVNQNMAYFPAFVEFRKRLATGEFGRLKHVDLAFHPQVKQLVARQFTHWMFATPTNILLELAVHPLSQLLALDGELAFQSVSAGPPMRLNAENGTYPELSVLLRSSRLSAGFHFMIGALCPAWHMVAFCEDATVCIDMIANTIHVQGRRKYLPPLDYALSTSAGARALISQSARNLYGYAASQIGLKPRSDAFFESIKGSILDFYASLDRKHQASTDARFGARLVQLCGQIGAALPVIEKRESQLVHAQPDASGNPFYGKRVLLIGGTGFIGRPTVKLLLELGAKVRVMARGTRNLPDLFASPHVEVARGDVKNAVHLDAAMKDVDLVCNLAHGGGGGSLAEMKASMVDSAIEVVHSAARAGIKRVVHIGSVAGLYLGDASEVITGATPPDPQPEKRGDYAHAKALADLAFVEACRSHDIEWVILRPGVVVGDGTAPLHNGVGHTNNDQHVIGWNDGRNPLPFVLADDCATAILGALSKPAAANKAYNLGGDVVMTAREYMDELVSAVGRPLQFHSTNINGLFAVEIWKYLVKTIGGKRIPFPSKRDFTSRAMLARFDCSDAKRDLGWQPQADRAAFVEQAIRIHADQR
jgi:predicted dehydrogenase/nucleoside-diphosphate-sugar epimerase